MTRSVGPPLPVGHTVAMKVVVIHQSRTGNTRRAAEFIGGAAEVAGATVTVRPATNLDYKELAEAVEAPAFATEVLASVGALA